MDNLILLPAILFPAIPLMMSNFGNRYIALSNLIRKIHDEFINKKISKNDKSAIRYLAQIKILRQRLFLNRMKWENEEESTIFYKGFGQEFILDVEKNPNVMKWAMKLIKKHG